MLTTIIGTTGATIILILFILSQTKKLDSDSLGYDFWNFVGSLLLVLYAILLKSYPFLVLNTVWAAFSLKDVLTYIMKKYGK